MIHVLFFIVIQVLDPVIITSGNKKHREEKLFSLEEGLRVSQEKMVSLEISLHHDILVP